MLSPRIAADAATAITMRSESCPWAASAPATIKLVSPGTSAPADSPAQGEKERVAHSSGHVDERRQHRALCRSATTHVRRRFTDPFDEDTFTTTCGRLHRCSAADLSPVAGAR